MEILRHIEGRDLSLPGSVVTLGNFDGIHRGHQVLIQNAVRDAKEIHLPSVVLTFEPHPLKVLAPERAPKLILTHKDKMQLFQSLGIDIVIIKHFDPLFANVAADEFVREFLIDRLRVKKLWVGRDLRFGRNRQAGVEELIRWGAGAGFQVGVVDPILVEGARISSSRIRTLVESGRVDQVVDLLGRYHFISGKVVGGHRRGRELGFPTANIASRTEVVPKDGIYATFFYREPERLLSVTNVGVNPTFGDGPRTIEAFILDFTQELYGQSVKLLFVKRIRDEKKFASVEQLGAQIARDVVDARTIFDQVGASDNLIPASSSH